MFLWENFLPVTQKMATRGLRPLRAHKNFDRGRFRLDSPSSGGRVNSATKRLTGVAISAEPFNAQ